MLPWLILYILVGPALWLFFGFGLASARIRLNKLSRKRPKPKDTLPGVTVMVPARNEGPGIHRCLESILNMDYPGDLKLIAVDDRSTDQTHAEMLRVAENSNGRLTVLQIKDLPDHWLGKCHALHTAAKLADTPWLLFVDSDVTVEKNALSDVMTMALARHADAVSLLTRQRCETFLERICTPLACGAVVAMYTGALTNDDNKKDTAFANGQFFLIRREPYEKVGGHEAVRFLATEDVDLMRILKKADFKVRLYQGDHLAETRMYDSIPRMYKGWARIYSTASHRRPWRILGAMLFTLLGMAAWITPFLFWNLGSVPGTPLMDTPWITHLWRGAAMIHLLAVFIDISYVYRWAGVRPWLAIFYPVAGAVQLSYFAYALWWCITKKVEWRGTVYYEKGTRLEANPHSQKPTPP